MNATRLSSSKSECRTKKELGLRAFLASLRDGKIFYRLSQHRDDAIMVEVAVPGERWEVEFLEDGSVEAEVFRSDGEIRSESAIDELLRRHADST
jgi:hypothetical protein